MADLRNILHSGEELNEEQLKKYLSGDGSTDELHSVEKKMAEDDFVNDAVEGLQDFSSQEKLEDYISQLNKKLHQQLEVPKERKKKRQIKDLSWVIIAVIIILIVCVLGYLVIRIQKERENQGSKYKVVLHSSHPDKFIV